MKWFNLTKIYFLLVVGLLFFASAFAESKRETVYTKFSDQQIVDILKTAYNDISILQKGTIVFKANGVKHIIDNSRDDAGLTFVVFFTSNTNLAKLNEWNRDRKFISAYLDKDNEVVLKSDLDVKLGISEAYLLEAAIRFVFGVNLFVREQAK